MPHEPGHPPEGGSLADQYGPPPGAQGAQQALDGPDLIGGFHGATRTGAAPFLPDGSPNMGPFHPDLARATYYEGDEFAILRGLTTEDRVRLQQQMVAVGLAPGTVAFGEIDDATKNAMTSLLTMSNRAGTEWQDTLNRVATRPEVQERLRGGGQEFQERAYLAPDYATWATRVKAMFREQLGREPEEDELAQFTAELQGWDKQNFDAEEQARRAGFEGEGGGMTADAVDPLARFTQQFEKVYSGELDFLEDKDEAVKTQDITDAATGTLSAMSRGQF